MGRWEPIVSQRSSVATAKTPNQVRDRGHLVRLGEASGDLDAPDFLQGRIIEHKSRPGCNVETKFIRISRSLQLCPKMKPTVLIQRKDCVHQCGVQEHAARGDSKQGLVKPREPNQQVKPWPGFPGLRLQRPHRLTQVHTILIKQQGLQRRNELPMSKGCISFDPLPLCIHCGRSQKQKTKTKAARDVQSIANDNCKCPRTPYNTSSKGNANFAPTE
jgi:hypothetical protein